MNNSRAVTPLAEAEDDAIGTKQFSTVVEVEKLQTMMQGQNGQVVFVALFATIL